jgi:hypothetical protein
VIDVSAARGVDGGFIVLDLVYVGVTVGFAAMAAAFMVACDKIIESDEVALEEDVRGAQRSDTAERGSAV